LVLRAGSSLRINIVVAWFSSISIRTVCDHVVELMSMQTYQTSVTLPILLSPILRSWEWGQDACHNAATRPRTLQEGIYRNQKLHCKITRIVDENCWKDGIHIILHSRTIPDMRGYFPRSYWLQLVGILDDDEHNPAVTASWNQWVRSFRFRSSSHQFADFRR